MGSKLPFSTSWSDVESFIHRSGGVDRSGFTRWVNNGQRRRASDFAKWFEIYKQFRHEYLFQIKPSAIFDHIRILASKPEEHALGTLKARDQTRIIRDVTPTAPIMLSFHTVLEHYKRPFTWTEFWNFHLLNEDYFLRHALDALGIALPARDVDFNGNLDLRSIRFRLGMGFYTGWKEAYVLSSLRHTHRLDVRYHFFLDLEWKADLYTEDILVEIFVNNDAMKSISQNTAVNGLLSTEMHGRKTPCSERNPLMKVLIAAKDAGNRFGSCWLHSENEAAWIASRLTAYGCPLIR